MRLTVGVFFIKINFTMLGNEILKLLIFYCREWPAKRNSAARTKAQKVGDNKALS